MLYGFFMKLVISDNCAKYVNITFENPSLFHGATLFLAVCLFSFQIYCDFAGYSLIAIGTANLFGFSLMMNFNKPYFSTDISKFWSRWHISLTTWFKDYLYIPLGGSRFGTFITLRNVLIVFMVSGLWHGANYTFLMWGFVNALLFVPFVLFSNRSNRHRSHKNTIIGRLNYVFKILLTFVLISLTWIFFRSETLTKAFYILRNIFSLSFFRSFYMDIRQLSDGMNLLYFIFILILFVSYEWISKDELNELSFIDKIKSRTIKLLCYYMLLVVLSLFATGSQDFIYFQF